MTTIPYLVGSVLFAHCAEVYLRHAPTAPGQCACGRVPCHRRQNAASVIEAAGVDPATITVEDTLPRPWHERSAQPSIDRVTNQSVRALYRMPSGNSRWR